MKLLPILTFAIALFTLFTSCQSTSAQMQGLSNKETRKGIMNSIANDSMMSQEMIGAMMNTKNGMKMMQGHQMMMGNYNSMMSMLKGNPGMMQNMMSAMMETAKGDTAMMAEMINTMMGNHQMMGMMQHKTGNSSMHNNMGDMNHK